MTDAELTVAKDRVVEFHYTLRDTSGEILEDTQNEAPKKFLFGRSGLLPGIERALRDRKAGDVLDVELPPAEAFGVRREDLTQRVSKKYFEAPKRLRAGMTAVIETRDGRRPVTILKVGAKVVDVDLNHPRAGMTLSFHLEVVSVRAADASELAHGHAH